MPKARTSLVFKGPANPTRRGRKSAAGAESTAPANPAVNRPVKKLPASDSESTRGANDSLEEDVSDKKRGKRKAVDQDDTNDSLPDIHVHPYHASIALSTVEKTWRPLHETSRDEIEQLAKRIETDYKLDRPSSVSKSDLKHLVARYISALLTNLEDLQLPPFPATLKSRTTTSKDHIDLIDPEVVKKKIESTKASLEKEAKLIRELEREIADLKGEHASGNSREQGSEGECPHENDGEDSDVMVVLPVKKPKKQKVASTDEHVTGEASPPPKKAVKSSSRAKPLAKNSKPDPPSRVTLAPKATKSILKPHPPIATTMEGSDDFDTFPTAASTLKTKTKTTKVRTQSPRRVPTTTTTRESTTAKSRRPSLAGKKALPAGVQREIEREEEPGPKKKKKSKQ